MLNEKERWVKVFDFNVNSVPMDSPHFSLADVVVEVRKLFQANDTSQMMQKNQVKYSLSDMRIDEENSTLALLVHMSDKRLSDPVLSDFDSGDQRSANKSDSEGISYSAHMLISLEETSKSSTPNSFTYRAVLEDVSGLTRSHMVPYITYLFKSAHKGWKYMDGDTGKKKSFYPSADFHEHPAMTAEEALKGKTINYVYFTEINEVKGFDTDSYLRPVKKEVKFQVVKDEGGFSVAGFLGSVKDTLQGKQNNFDRARITYSDPAKKKTRPEVLSLEREQEAASTLLCKQNYIALNSKISQCEKNVVDELYAKMLVVLQHA